MKSNISFDETKHEYTVGGIFTPSVTKILKANGLMDCFRHNPVALDNGTAVHKGLELYDLGMLDTRNIDPKLVKCINLWIKFKKRFEIRDIIEVEKKVAFGCMFAGTIDRIVELDNGKLMTLDFKTGNQQRWGALQTAGYTLAYDPRDFKKYERCCVKIHWDMDEARYCPYHDEEDFNTFMAMATVYHWKNKNGYLREEKEYGNNGEYITDTGF